MPLVGASPVYRPPVAGEPIRLREDGHWSTKGLVGYWPMNEMRGGMTVDASGFQNHGQLRGEAHWGAADEGGGGVRVYSGGSGFDSNMWVVPKTPELSFRTTDSFTFGSVWTARVYHDGHPLVSRNDANPFVWLLLRSDGSLDIAVNATSVRSAALYYTYIPGKTYAMIGSWDAASQTLRGCLNGVYSETTQSLPDRECTSGDYWATRNQYNNWNDKYERQFDGVIHRQMIWRMAFSEQELRALSAAPDLPIWRPRRGISLAGLAVPTGRPRPFTQHRHGPRLILGGII